MGNPFVNGTYYTAVSSKSYRFHHSNIAKAYLSEGDGMRYSEYACKPTQLMLNPTQTYVFRQQILYIHTSIIIQSLRRFLVLLWAF